eukprot:2511709-Amphidinium_carterae.1
MPNVTSKMLMSEHACVHTGQEPRRVLGTVVMARDLSHASTTLCVSEKSGSQIRPQEIVPFEPSDCTIYSCSCFVQVQTSANKGPRIEALVQDLREAWDNALQQTNPAPGARTSCLRIARRYLENMAPTPHNFTLPFVNLTL